MSSEYKTHFRKPCEIWAKVDLPGTLSSPLLLLFSFQASLAPAGPQHICVSGRAAVFCVSYPKVFVMPSQKTDEL